MSVAGSEHRLFIITVQVNTFIGFIDSTEDISTGLIPNPFSIRTKSWFGPFVSDHGFRTSICRNSINTGVQCVGKPKLTISTFLSEDDGVAIRTDLGFPVDTFFSG